ncbi:VIR protein [Plasmodium vivax]|uniref:VIR protein n=1 Tax=Plasmodium vivax TaxID=5855 RepID=A0A1G4EIG4_PLAVI|nr:VIR protein [Plasmodium vivax]
MSEEITDIANWEKKYHFLEKVWSTYKDFDKHVEDDKSLYYSLCNLILKGASVELSNYKIFCMKLMRNLGRYSLDPNIYEPTRERCNMLYNWIYNSIEKNKTTNDVVNKCFQEYTDNMKYVKKEKKCSKLVHEGNFVEPIKITLLDIFDNNTPAIINTLNDANPSIRGPGKKFVCECVKIYKNMYKTYCLKNRQESEKNETTCLRLDNFNKTYWHFISSLKGSNHNIPLLSDGDNVLLAKCSPDKLKLPLIPVEDQNTDLPSESEIYANPKHTGSILEDGLSTPLESTNNSMKKNITTTIGTVAGASSLLALLYRYTPAKNMIYSRFRGSRGRVHSNMYEDGHNELFSDHGEENFSSYNERYNIAYSSV